MFTGSLIKDCLANFGYALLGMGLLLGVWWLGSVHIANNPDLIAFSAFAPEPAFEALLHLVGSGTLWPTISSSLARILSGLLLGVAIGVPTGVLIGYIRAARKIANMPFQFLRMISPLAWMPIAVLAFDTWDGAIVFLIFMAAVWPIVFSTSHGVSRMDPSWFKVANNLGASTWHLLRTVILPAILTDVMSGIRLAVGVAWIVLVPAEYLGVTSGLGYAINDARDTLEYDTLAAIVLVIGTIGFLLDWVCGFLIRRYNWHMDT
ncbi:MAG: ABC transporter permease [Granulosicoccus sp.]